MHATMPATMHATMPATMHATMPATMHATMPATMHATMPATMHATMPATMHATMLATMQTKMPKKIQAAMEPEQLPATIPKAFPAPVSAPVLSVASKTIPVTAPPQVPNNRPLHAAHGLGPPEKTRPRLETNGVPYDGNVVVRDTPDRPLDATGLPVQRVQIPTMGDEVLFELRPAVREAIDNHKYQTPISNLSLRKPAIRCSGMVTMVHIAKYLRSILQIPDVWAIDLSCGGTSLAHAMNLRSLFDTVWPSYQGTLVIEYRVQPR